MKRVDYSHIFWTGIHLVTGPPYPQSEAVRQMRRSSLTTISSFHSLFLIWILSLSGGHYHSLLDPDEGRRLCDNGGAQASNLQRLTWLDGRGYYRESLPYQFRMLHGHSSYSLLTPPMFR